MHLLYAFSSLIIAQQHAGGKVLGSIRGIDPLNYLYGLIKQAIHSYYLFLGPL